MGEIRKLSEPEFKKIFTTNYKGSTPSFDEKNHKIHHHHNNDHTYAKNIIIDSVNDYCLAEIFMHVPICERPKIAQVCKKWKRALDDSWFNVKKLELIHWNYDEFPNCLKKFPSIDGELSFLKSLLNKCGRYLTKLDLTAYSHCNIVPVINDSCPNLVKLRLRFIYIDDVILLNAFTRLSKLKELTIIFHFFNNESISATLINSLRNVANTLTNLNLLSWVYGCCQMGYILFPGEITCVIPELKALKKFEVAGIYVTPAILNYVANNEIFMADYYSYYCLRTGYEYNKTTNLDLSHYRVTDNSLYTIANVMRKLKVMYIFCEWITDDGIVAISKMNELDTLEFIGRNNVTDSSIKLLKNLKKLKLPISDKITDVSVTKVVENSPDMEMLYVEDTGVTVKFIKKAADISKNRKLLLRLFYSSVTFIPDIEQYKSQYFDVHIIQQEQKQIITSAHANSLFIDNVRVHFWERALFDNIISRHLSTVIH